MMGRGLIRTGLFWATVTSFVFLAKFGLPSIKTQNNPLNSSVMANSSPCPDGYYLQGYDHMTNKPACSPPPTGCPYAERIPKDSPKCVPQEYNIQSEAVYVGAGK